MSTWQDLKAERNRQSLARLTKALPQIFPPLVLRRALGRPFVPPTPRLAIDSYWRAHPLRADRLARALAAKSGAPDDWTWRLAGSATAACRRRSARRRRLIAKPHMRAVRAFAASAVSRCTVSAGMSICGMPARTKMPPGTAPASSPGSSGTRRAAKRGSCAACRRGAAPQSGGRLMEERRSRPSRAAVPGVERASRHAVAGIAGFLGPAEPAGDQPRAHVAKCAGEARERSVARRRAAITA